MFSEWITQTVRLYNQSNALEIEWTVGPVPLDDGLGKELITRFSTNIASSGVLYTDSNARDMLPRRRCMTRVGVLDPACRPSVSAYNVTEPVAGNYWPINAQVTIGLSMRS